MRILKITIAAVVIASLSITAFAANAAKPESGRGQAVLSCDTYSLRSYLSEGKLDYLTVPAKLKELGIPAITYNDIWMKSYDTAYLDQIKKACADSGIEIVGFICEGNLANLDDKAWQAQIDEDAKKMKAAAYLGAKAVRLNLGGLGDEKKDDTIGADRCIAAFKQLLPLARELNIKMTIENHGGVSKKADTILKVIKGSDPRWVGSCLDFGNWPADVRYRESLKLAPYAYHVHAKTHTFNDQGEDTDKDYKRLLGMLRINNYRYAVGVRYHLPPLPLAGEGWGEGAFAHAWAGSAHPTSNC